MSVLSRAIAYWRTGGSIAYDGYRDYYKVFGWLRNPQHQHFVDMYLFSEVAGRVVDAPAKALWSDPPILQGDDAFNAAWTDFGERIPIFSALQRLDKLAGLGRYAVMLVGFDDGLKLEMPINRQRANKVIYVQPYLEGAARIIKYDTDQTSPRYGKPILYQISPQNIDPNIKTYFTEQQIGLPFFVHYSRILHVADNSLESSIFGHSRLEGVYNTLCDLFKVTGGSAETFWLTANRGLHIDIDKDMELDPADAANLSDELREYEHELRRTIRTRGATINALGSTTADPTQAFNVLLSLVSIRTGIPQLILRGVEQGHLASQEDRAQWAQRIAERTNEFGGPIMLYPLLQLLIDANVLPKPQKLLIQWPDAFKLNPLERGQTSAQMARSAANLAKALMTTEQLNQLAAKARIATQQPGQFNPATGEQGPATTTPALLTTPATEITLLSEQECRSIIGFGKHPPTFDENQQGIDATIKDPEE